MKPKNLSRVRSLSFINRTAIEAAEKCACFKCLKTFSPAEIKEWTHKGQTALCPACGIDAVLPESAELVLTKELLQDMQLFYFLDIVEADWVVKE